MFFSARDKGEMASMVYNWENDDVDAVVVTDGSRWSMLNYWHILASFEDITGSVPYNRNSLKSELSLEIKQSKWKWENTK